MPPVLENPQGLLRSDRVNSEGYICFWWLTCSPLRTLQGSSVFVGGARVQMRINSQEAAQIVSMWFTGHQEAVVN